MKKIDKSALFSRQPVTKITIPPVIVIGLPRSGSSYLAYLLSQTEDWFVFDDLYPYQKAAELGITSTLNLSTNPEKLKALLNRLGWQLRAKIKFEQNFWKPELELDETFLMEECIVEALKDSPTLYWPQVVEEWMTRLTYFNKKKRWGYKTPQDFMHIRELVALFPAAQFIFIQRDPFKMLQSFKNLPKVKTSGTQDGESRQYHPYFYSLYWRRAFEAITDCHENNLARIETVKFEDLISEPEKVSERLANLLETKVSGEIRVEKGNTSYSNAKKKNLTNLEIAICQKVIGEKLTEAGYNSRSVKIKPLEFLDLLSTTWTFSIYQFMRIVKDKKSRNSIYSFIKKVLKLKS